MSSPRIAVLGLGNLMRADDAVGMLALERLRSHPRFPRSVLAIDGGTLGLDLLHPLHGITHLLAIDAIEGGLAPGALLRFSGSAVDDLPIGRSVHLLGFADLLSALRLTGAAPAQVVVLGVQPQAIGWSTELTPPVEAALPDLVEAVLDQIAEWQAENSASLPAGFPVSASAPVAL